MTDTIGDEKILDELKQWRKRIILALYRHGELGAGEVRSITGTPRGSKEHHYETLQDWGLMEQVGTQQKRGGEPERLFALTDRGTQFVEEYLVDADEAPDMYAVKIDRTEDKVDELRGTVADLERTVEQQANEIETLRQERDDALDELREDREQALDEFIDKLENKLNGEYRALLKEDILDEIDEAQ